MSKIRAVSKYTTVAVVTGLYSLVAVQAWQDQLPTGPVDRKRVAIVAGALTAALWMTALL